MIRTSLILISNSQATPLDIVENIKSAYTLVVQNVNASGYIYIGNLNVTANNYGYKIYPGQAFTVELPSRSTMYAIASGSNMSVSVMEIDRAI